LKHNQQAKETRIRGLIPRYESKSIFHIEGECGDLEEELLTFPKGIHDDVIDSLAYQLQIAFQKQSTYKVRTY
jgi:phage terminase large subunit-like protein